MEQEDDDSSSSDEDEILKDPNENFLLTPKELTESLEKTISSAEEAASRQIQLISGLMQTVYVGIIAISNFKSTISIFEFQGWQRFELIALFLSPLICWLCSLVLAIIVTRGTENSPHITIWQVLDKNAKMAPQKIKILNMAYLTMLFGFVFLAIFFTVYLFYIPDLNSNSPTNIIFVSSP